MTFYRIILFSSWYIIFKDIYFSPCKNKDHQHLFYLNNLKIAHKKVCLPKIGYSYLISLKMLDEFGTTLANKCNKLLFCYKNIYTVHLRKRVMVSLV